MKTATNVRFSPEVHEWLEKLAQRDGVSRTAWLESIIREKAKDLKPMFTEIKLVNLQDIPLPAWLPFDYINGLADAIEKSGFVPPIIILEDELLTPDVVAALVTIRARGTSVPKGIAVQDGKWLVRVDRRESKTVTEKVYIHEHYHDWWEHVQPPRIWYTTTGTYFNSPEGGTLTWNSNQPLMSSSVNSVSDQFKSLNSGVVDKMGTAEQVKDFWDKYGTKDEDGNLVIRKFNLDTL